MISQRIKNIIALSEKTYGKLGSKIPGSKLFRGYCTTCGEPIRNRDGVLGLCSKCSEDSEKVVRVGHKPRIDRDDDDEDGSWANCVKAYEE